MAGVRDQQPILDPILFFRENPRRSFESFAAVFECHDTSLRFLFSETATVDRRRTCRPEPFATKPQPRVRPRLQAPPNGFWNGDGLRRLRSRSRILAMPKTDKKADVTERPGAFHHVGLLVNEPPDSAGLLFIQSANVFDRAISASHMVYRGSAKRSYSSTKAGVYKIDCLADRAIPPVSSRNCGRFICSSFREKKARGPG